MTGVEAKEAEVRHARRFREHADPPVPGEKSHKTQSKTTERWEGEAQRHLHYCYFVRQNEVKLDCNWDFYKNFRFCRFAD